MAEEQVIANQESDPQESESDSRQPDEDRVESDQGVRQSGEDHGQPEAAAGESGKLDEILSNQKAIRGNQSKMLANQGKFSPAERSVGVGFRVGLTHGEPIPRPQNENLARPRLRPEPDLRARQPLRVLTHDRLDIPILLEPQLTRSRDVERTRPRHDRPGDARVRRTRDQRAGRGTADPLETVEHLARSRGDPRQIHGVLTRQRFARQTARRAPDSG